MRKDAYLDELIQILEKEKKALKKIIDEHVEEGDYGIAHKYSKGLREISSRLRTLYHFQDPFNERRNILIREKKKLTDNLDKFKGKEFWTDYYLDLLNRLHSELGDEATMRLQPFEDTQHIDDALCDVFDSSIKSFRLIFKELNFDMKFERQPGDILSWSIGPLKALRKAGLLRKKHRRQLEGLGFIMPANKDRFVYHYDLSTFKDALSLKQLLARVIYDVFMMGNIYDRIKVELYRGG